LFEILGLSSFQDIAAVKLFRLTGRLGHFGILVVPVIPDSLHSTVLVLQTVCSTFPIHGRLFLTVVTGKNGNRFFQDGAKNY
jgi:hypothetical protein